jgi:hypothetical protein
VAAVRLAVAAVTLSWRLLPREFAVPYRIDTPEDFVPSNEYRTYMIY